MAQDKPAPMISFHFDIGNSNDGPLGMCARVNATSKAEAVKKLQQYLNALIDGESLPPMDAHPDIEYATVYFGEMNITENDIDEGEDDEPEPMDPEARRARIAELTARIKAEEISVENGATAQHDDNGNVRVDMATCGTCGMSWNDALITSRTPAPSARCPYEYIHKEIAELRALQNSEVSNG